MQVASTNLKREAGNTKDGFCDWVQLRNVNILLVILNMGQLTSAKTAPYFIALSTDFSVDELISGEYSCSNPSSSWSDERRASTYVMILSWWGWPVEKVRTVLLAENRTTREPTCFPITTGSVLPSEGVRGLIGNDD